MKPILEVKKLVKRYKNVSAVDGISFSLRPGICFGLLGPNGAGKTTAMEVIEEILYPTSGEILFKGVPIGEASFREKIGIQFQHTSLLNFLTVSDTLKTFMSLYRETEPIDWLVEVCNLGEIMGRMNDKLSGGQSQRLMLALALINKPELIFLDEPSTGLDPQARRNLWEIVSNIKEKGRTIILTTHSMAEAEYLCDQIAIMDHGRIIAEGSPTELVERHCSGGTISLPRQNVTMPLGEIPFPWREINGRLEISAERINTGLERLLAMQINLADMTVHSPNLEDVFLNLTGRQLRD